MGGIIPYIGTGAAVILGLLIVGGLYALSLPALVGTVNVVAGLFPAPFSPVAVPGGTLAPSPGAILLTIALLGALLGLALKLLDAPKPKLGSGQRFRSLEHQLAHRPGVKNPSAVAASIGRKKYGKKRFQRLSLRGRSRRR